MNLSKVFQKKAVDLTRGEELALRAIYILNQEKTPAYTLTILDLLEEHTHDRPSIGTLHGVLTRLIEGQEQKDENGDPMSYLETTRGTPTGGRGGRERVLYFITSRGMKALHELDRIHEKWSFPVGSDSTPAPLTKRAMT